MLRPRISFISFFFLKLLHVLVLESLGCCLKVKVIMRFVESLKETNIYVNTGLCVTVSCMFLSSVILSPLSSGCMYI